MKKFIFFLLLLTSCKPTIEEVVKESVDSVNINDHIYILRGEQNLMIITDQLNAEEWQDAKTEIYCDHVDVIYGSTSNPTQVYLNQLEELNKHLTSSKEMREYYKQNPTLLKLPIKNLEEYEEEEN